MRCIGQALERHRVGGNALGPGRGRASARVRMSSNWRAAAEPARNPRRGCSN